jgi:hypothetical protein
LNPAKTSPYALYQYLFNSHDNDVENLLKLFTLIPLDEIATILQQHKQAPETRTAQQILAKNVTLLIHGEDGLKQAIQSTEALFKNKTASGSTLADLDEHSILQLLEGAPRVVAEKDKLVGMTIAELAVLCEACDSKSTVLFLASLSLSPSLPRSLSPLINSFLSSSSCVFFVHFPRVLSRCCPTSRFCWWCLPQQRTSVRCRLQASSQGFTAWKTGNVSHREEDAIRHRCESIAEGLQPISTSIRHDAPTSDEYSVFTPTIRARKR